MLYPVPWHSTVLMVRVPLGVSTSSKQDHEHKPLYNRRSLMSRHCFASHGEWMTVGGTWSANFKTGCTRKTTLSLWLRMAKMRSIRASETAWQCKENVPSENS